MVISLDCPPPIFLLILFRLNTTDGSKANASNISRGIFGANVGVDRLLKFFGEHDVKAIWFAPSHSIESFPEQLAKVRDAGHEL